MNIHKLIFIVLALLISCAKTIPDQLAQTQGTEIPTDAMTMHNFRTKSVKSINESTLSRGYNYVELTEGKRAFIKMNRSEIEQVVITDQNGRTLSSHVPRNSGGSGTLGFECSSIACTCNGDADCNDMFSTMSCSFEICFVNNSGGVVCVCAR